MTGEGEVGGSASAPWWSGVVDAIRGIVGRRRGKVLIGVTVLLGLLGAVAVCAGTPPSQRTFALTSLAVQLLMSVTVPFLGVLATTQLLTADRGAPVAPRLVAAAALAVSLALVGAAVGAVVLATAGSTVAGGAWQNAGTIVVGSVAVQVVAQLSGTGLGMLLRSATVAMTATVVLPLGLWAALGAVGVLQSAQVWVTPFPSAGHLLSGQMSGASWAQLLVVVLIWDVGLNALGARRVRHVTEAPAP